MDIQKLKALALAATPGPWEHSAPRPGTIFGFEVTAGSGDLVCQGSHHPSYRKEAAANTAFIAAANPAAVLELIAQRDLILSELKDCLDRLHWLNHPASGNTEGPWIKSAEAAIAKCGGAK